jgi:hypothetical protein
MTRDEIMQLTAEELRLEVAKAKGFVQFKNVRSIFNGIEYDVAGWFVKSEEGPLGTFHQAIYSDWPANIADAWELVEDFGKLSWSFTVENIPDRPTEVLCHVFRPFQGGGFLGCGTTAPLAICRAWLVWKSEKP